MTLPLSTTSGTLTILFTDLEGSTQLWERHPATMRAALTRHDALLRGSVEAAGGQVVKTTGDGLHAVFGEPGAAVAAVLAGQRAVLAEAWGEVGPLRVRMALHTGEAEARAGDYFGPAVNRAARLMAIAHGGQVLLSAACAERVRGQLPAETGLSDLGQHRLKDLSQPEHVFQLCAPGLPAEFPALRSLAVFPTNLPVQLTRLIGRESELAEARALLNEPACRLLTLTGPGGTGKTRLALQLAAEELDRFADGAWLVELAPLADPALVPRAIAAALGVREQPGRTLLEALIDFLRRKHLLLLLDNCEHVIEACAQTAAALLSQCPQLKLLASSREPLGVPGERVFRVPSLALPNLEASGPTLLEAVRQSEAGQLFVERAVAGQPRFVLNEHNSAVIAQIVQRLDGIPLAIELAAARVRVLSPEQIAARLDDRFRLLTGGSRTALPRHQTLLAAIEWSYQLLSEPERVLLRRLSVFAGGWLLEAAEHAGADEAPPAGSGTTAIGAPDLLELLSHLVDKSLVLVDDSAAGEPRYRLLETIRQFARDKLVEAGEAERVRHRHFSYFLRFTETAEPQLLAEHQLAWLDRMEVEHDNLRTALAWAFESQPPAAVRLAAHLFLFWQRRGYLREGRNWLTRVLERTEALPPAEADPAFARAQAVSRGLALAGLATLQINLGEHEDAARAAGAGVAMLEATGDQRALALALGMWGMSLVYAGNLPSARAAALRGEALARSVNDPLSLSLNLSALMQIDVWADNNFPAAHARIEEELRLGRQAGDRWLVAEALYGMGLMAYAEGDWLAARRGLTEAHHTFNALGDRSFTNMARSGLADVARKLGDLTEAQTQYQAVIDAWREVGHRPGIARCLECLAFVAAAQNQVQAAATLLGAAEVLRELLAAPMMPDEQTEYGQELAALRGQVTDPAAFDAAWQSGRQMDYDQAVEFALRPGEVLRQTPG